MVTVGGDGRRHARSEEVGRSSCNSQISLIVLHVLPVGVLKLSFRPTTLGHCRTILSGFLTGVVGERPGGESG